MKKLIIILVVLVVGCVSRIEVKNMPPNCQALYDVLYLSQKYEVKPDVTKFIDSCRKQNNIEFCKKQRDYTSCISLMKSF